MDIDAELRLGPPGAGNVQPKKRALDTDANSEASGTDDKELTTPAPKAQVVGWPPVRAYRKNTVHATAVKKAAAGREQGGALYVKVSMDGAPYLRKVDLKMYRSYRELREALDVLFRCFSAPGAYADGGGSQFAVAYEDKDGDLMLAGDVPWDMFISSCKKLRIMRGSEACR